MKKFSSFGDYQTIFESWRKNSGSELLSEGVKDVLDVALKSYEEANNDKDKMKIKNAMTALARTEGTLEEGEMTPDQIKKRDEVYASLDPEYFKKKYGKRWKEVMGAVATTTAMGKK